MELFYFSGCLLAFLVGCFYFKWQYDTWLSLIYKYSKVEFIFNMIINSAIASLFSWISVFIMLLLWSLEEYEDSKIK